MICPTREGSFITKTHRLQNLFLLFFYLHTITFSGKNHRLFTEKLDHQLQTVQIKINSNHIALTPLKLLFKVIGFHGIEEIGKDRRRF